MEKIIIHFVTLWANTWKPLVPENIRKLWPICSLPSWDDILGVDFIFLWFNVIHNLPVTNSLLHWVLLHSITSFPSCWSRWFIMCISVQNTLSTHLQMISQVTLNYSKLYIYKIMVIWKWWHLISHGDFFLKFSWVQSMLPSQAQLSHLAEFPPDDTS